MHRELDIYLQALGLQQLEFGELHFGGGTPTFLTVEELQQLLEGLFQRARPRTDAVASVEVDPRVTSREQAGADGPVRVPSHQPRGAGF